MRNVSIAPVLALTCVLVSAIESLAAWPALADTPFGSEQVILTDIENGAGVSTADLDGDDQLDVVAIGLATARYALNQGDAAGWTVVDLPDGGDYREIESVDVDGDGDFDVVTSDWLNGDLLWYSNEIATSGGFGDAQEICTGCDPDHFEFVDLDGDLDVDLVVTHRAGQSFAWYENENGDATSWLRHDLDGSNHSGPQGLDVDDIDGDGDLDVVGTTVGGGQLVWFENLGGAASWTPHVVENEVFVAVLAVDLDLDGDVDFVTQRSNPDPEPGMRGFIEWFENASGDGSTFELHLVDSALPSAGRGLQAVDLDFDGDLDLVGHPGGDWFENLATDPLTWTRRSFAGSSGGHRDTAVADLDRDGDLDILAARRSADRASWWANLACTLADPDADGDGARDACDRCPGEDDFLDADGDTVPDGCDICVLGDDRVDTDGDGTPNACDGDGTLTIDDVTAVETDSGTATFTFTVSHQGSVADPFTVGYQTQDGSAAAEGDYGSQSGTLAFDGDPGETRSIAVTVNGDTAVEVDETFTVELGIPTNPRVAVLDASGLGTIQNDDGASVRISDVSLAEGDVGGTVFVFEVTLDAAVQGGVSVDYTTGDGTATEAAGDYAATSGTIVFDGTEAEVETVTVTVQGDEFVEDDEFFEVVLSNVSDAYVTLADELGLGTIQNDDSASIAIDDVAIVEGDSGSSAFTFTVLMTGELESGFSVDYETVDGTATTADGDYVATSGTLFFDGTDGDSETVVVNVQGDLAVEPDEIFLVVLGTPSSPQVSLGDGSGLGTIANDDTVFLTLDDPSVIEGSAASTTNLVFTVTLTGNLPGGFTVPFETTSGTAIGGSDFISTAGSLAFSGSDGETQTVTVNVVGDDVVESDEYFEVDLGTPSDPKVEVPDADGLGTIEDDDTATIRLGDVTSSEGNSGVSSFIFTASLDGAVQDGFTVAFETSDGSANSSADYTSHSGLLAFAGADGETEFVVVSVQGDTVVESDETFTVELGSPSNPAVGVSDGSGLGTILNDDSATIAIGDFVAAEGDSGDTSFIFDVALGGLVEGGFTVAFTTTDGSAGASDYTATSGILTFDGDEGEIESVTVGVTGDSVTEGDETFTVELGSPSNPAVGVSDGTGLGTILNDDSASVSIADLAASEGDSGPVGFGFAVTLAGAVDEAFTVAFATTDGTATSASGDYDASSGTLTFDGVQGEEETLTVVVNGDTVPEDDEAFTVTLSAPSSSLVSLSDGTAQGLIANDDLVLSVAVIGSGHVVSAPVGIDCGDGASDCEEIYPAGTEVELTPTPSEDWEFAGWSGASDCEDGSVTLNGDRVCIATFDQGQVQLDIEFGGDGFGIVTSMPAGIECDRDGEPSDCSAAFDTGTFVDLTVEVTSVDTSFEGWTGDADCEDGSVDLDLAGDTVVCIAVLTVTPFFADGFESGDTTAWSSSVP